jgi:hypothetical protein
MLQRLSSSSTRLQHKLNIKMSLCFFMVDSHFSYIQCLFRSSHTKTEIVGFSHYGKIFSLLYITNAIKSLISLWALQRATTTAADLKQKILKKIFHWSNKSDRR